MAGRGGAGLGTALGGAAEARGTVFLSPAFNTAKTGRGSRGGPEITIVCKAVGDDPSPPCRVAVSRGEGQVTGHSLGSPREATSEADWLKRGNKRIIFRRYMTGEAEHAPSLPSLACRLLARRRRWWRRPDPLSPSTSLSDNLRRFCLISHCLPLFLPRRLLSFPLPPLLCVLLPSYASTDGNVFLIFNFTLPPLHHLFGSLTLLS